MKTEKEKPIERHRSKLTRKQVREVLQIYDNNIPSWLTIKDPSHIIITAAAYEGDQPKQVTITPKDLNDYYHYGTQTQSGMRGLGTVGGYQIYATDWRTADRIAEECLTIFRIINPRAVNRIKKNQAGVIENEKPRERTRPRRRGRRRRR